MSKQLLKKTASIAAALGMAVIIPATAMAAVTFGPSRPTYTWANPADHITFDSITDNPVFGDERQFVKSRNLTSPTTDYATSTTVTNGEDVVIEVYFHNNAASNLNLTATGTTVKFTLPSGSATTQQVRGDISATNATPGDVWATGDLSSSTPFTLTYEKGSAKLYTNYVSGATISDNVVSSGTLIGTNGADGNVPGCAQYSGYVTIRAKVNMVTPPPVTPPTKTVTKTVTITKNLPNTGAGSDLAIFAGAATLGGALHYLRAARRAGRQ